MNPDDLRKKEPTAVKRDSNDQKIVSEGQVGSDSDEARERARRSGMTKGTAGAAPTGDEYEQGAAGTNK